MFEHRQGTDRLELPLSPVKGVSLRNVADIESSPLAEEIQVSVIAV